MPVALWDPNQLYVEVLPPFAHSGADLIFSSVEVVETVALLNYLAMLILKYIIVLYQRKHKYISQKAHIYAHNYIHLLPTYHNIIIS